MLKDHNCGELTASNVSEVVTVAGWVHRRRDHGNLIFIDLRDREGLVQVVFNPELSPDAHRIADQTRNEYVLKVVGKVERRPSGTENPKMPTGEIEIVASEVEILNASKTPPFAVNEDVEIDENVRLRYRYLDLRRQRMQENMILRHQVVKFMRDFLDAKGFLEIETPILIKSSPEGARDYLVPSRMQPSKFYALPQSPQQLKQILMVAGYEKYFQVARCFRDEDLRADRQPEFTQLDIEMSFIDEEDMINLIDELFVSLARAVKPTMKVVEPVPRLSYAESMARFGSDKPDIRFGLELADVTDIAGQTDFKVFQTVAEQGGVVRGMCLPGCSNYSRAELNELTELAKTYGAKGLVTLSLDEGDAGLAASSTTSSVAKFIKSEQTENMAASFGAKAGDLLILVADRPSIANKVLSELRQEMGQRLGLIDPNTLAFVWIVDYPLLDWNEDERRWDPMHHPFTSPMEEDIPLLDAEPQKVRARHYDIVCNGCELSSGSIRIHRRELQDKIFNLLGYTQSEVEEKFGTLLEALENGAPPHGGIAPGIDRLVMILAGEQNIREVIPFPKNQNAVDVLFDAPSTVGDDQLRELYLSLRSE
jgi:aspartyl-tRNA synthetase